MERTEAGTAHRRSPRERGRRARGLVAAALALIVALQGAAFPPAARADSSVTVSNTGSELYDGFGTNYFRADGHLAFCTQPNLGTPDGRYAYDEAKGSDSRGAAIICTAMILAEHAVGEGYGSRNDVAEVASPLWQQTRRCLSMHNEDDSYYARLHVMLSYVFAQAWSGWCDPFNGTSNRGEWEEQSRAFHELCSAIVDGDAVDGVAPEAVEALRDCARQATVGVTRGNGSQCIAWLKSAPLGGFIELVKESSDPGVTDGNPCYSLAGAVYDVFKASGEWVCSITTDENGRAGTGRMPYGDYYVQEKTSSKGFQLDRDRHHATLSGRTAAVRVAEVPGLDPVAALLGKFDGERKFNGSANLPQGSAVLAGARFEVSWYPGYVRGIAPDGEGTHDWRIEAVDGVEGNWAADWPSIAQTAPGRTWTITTDEDGWATIPLEERFENSLGQVGLPYGTLVVREVAAPAGYLPNSTAYVRQIEPGASAPNVSTYDMPEVPEQVKRGDVSLVKFGETETDEDKQPEVKVPLAGVEFEIANLNGNPVIGPDGKEAAEGGVVCTIRTDDAGWASTETLRAQGASGSLPVGRYEVREVASTVPQGYKRVDPFEVEVVDDGQVLRYTLEDKTGTAIRVVKQDAETGRQVSGRMTFRVLDESMDVVTLTSHYPTVTVHSAFTTDSRGACVLPEKLAQGRYYIQEAQSPEGYVLSPDPVPFAVDSSTVGAWDEPIVVTVANSPQKGTIAITKTDSETGGAIASGTATFAVEAAEDVVTPDGTLRAVKGEVVAEVSTDGTGTARTGELYLGRYLVRETAAPAPYLLGKSPVEAVLSYAGQEVPVTSAAVSVPDEQARGTIEVVKTDAETGRAVPLAGAEFDVVATDDVLAGDGAVLVEAGEVVERLETDGSGRAETGPLYLSAYELVERAAPEGYVLSDGPVRVELAYAGQSTPVVKASAEFPDEPQKGTIALRKHDSHSGNPLQGAVYEVRAATDIATPDGTVRHKKGEVVSTMETDAEGVARSDELHLGTYEVVETKPPAGCALPDGAEGIVVTLAYAGQEAEAFEERVDAYDAPTEADVVKTRAGTGEPLEGASFAWWPAEAEIVIDAPEGAGAVGIAVEVPEGVDVAGVSLVPASGGSDDAGGASDEGAGREAVGLEGEGGAWIAEAPFGSYELRAAVSSEEGEPAEFDIASVDLSAESDTAVLRASASWEGGPGAEARTLAWSVEEADVLVAPEALESGATDEEGRIEARYLEPGIWKFRETEALPGYVLDEDVREVVVDESGWIEGKARFELALENDFTKVRVSKQDIAGKGELAGAELEVRDEEGAVVDSWTSDGEPHMIEALPAGDYVLVERAAPKDYGLAEDVAFTVEETGEVQHVTMYDEAIPGTLAALLPKTGDPLPSWAWLLGAALAAAAVLAIAGPPIGRGGKDRREPGSGDGEDAAASASLGEGRPRR